MSCPSVGGQLCWAQLNRQCVGRRQGVELSLQDWANLGEAVGGVAVVVTLAYLAHQIRQNTRMVRSATYQQVANSLTDFSALLAQHPDLCELYFRGGRLGLSSLSEPEHDRFALVLFNFFRRQENAFYQQVQGTLEPAAWAGVRESLSDVVLRPGVHQWWKQARARFIPEFAAFVDHALPKAAAQQGAAADAAPPAPIE